MQCRSLGGLNHIRRSAGSLRGTRVEPTTIPIAIANLSVELNVPATLVGAVRRRYRGFTQSSSASLITPALRLFASGSPALTPSDPETLPRIDVTTLDPTCIRLAGDCSGQLDLAAMRGEIHGPNALTALDALLRLALSLLAPRAGWLLLHGAAIALTDGRWGLLLGRSGAGKSTAARAFKSFCDELVLARPGGAGCEAASTPYWGGLPGRAECGALVCLDKGGDPDVRRLRGADAVRALAPHALRHVRLGQSEENAMTAICDLAHCAPVFEVRCPTGFQFVPFLNEALVGLGCAPFVRQPAEMAPDVCYA